MTFSPGIYFGLAEEAYHADPALSSSGIKNLLISPLDYWINSPLNPEYVDEKTPAMIAGTAFHRRLLEPARFAALYAAEPSKDDWPDAIDGHEALKAECDRLDLKKSGRIMDLCERILEADPRAQLWPVIRESLADELGDRIALKRDVMADIERAARLVLAHDSARKALTGGMAEVSIFWTDPDTGIRMKARLDYLKTKAIVDVKTFANSLSKPVDTAIAHAVANNGYPVQAVVYCEAVRQAKQMLRSAKSKAVRHVSGLEPDNGWLVQLAAVESHAFFFVFIETGAVTNVRVREFRPTETYGGRGGTANLYWQSGEAGFREGVRRYVVNMERYGPDQPWIDDAPARPFNDTDFPMWMFS